jgi:peptidoglycan LD-endopeptidase CwlK
MLNDRSINNLVGVHPDLVKVVMEADRLCRLHTPSIEFIITEGVRSLERQKMLFEQHLSGTMNSRHLTGHAIDFAPLIEKRVTWKTPAFLPVIQAFRQAASALSILIKSGSEWRTLKDYPHIELSWKAYP